MKRRNIYGVARVWKGKEEEEDPRCCNKMVAKTKLKEREFPPVVSVLFNMESSDKRPPPSDVSPRQGKIEGRGSFITWLGETNRAARSREASGFLGS